MGDELVDRSAAPVPRALDCFDPRSRFGTVRGLSGVKELEREESEIYGVTACCPLPRYASLQSMRCNVFSRGGCVRLNLSSAGIELEPSTIDYQTRWHANIRGHLRA